MIFFYFFYLYYRDKNAISIAEVIVGEISKRILEQKDNSKDSLGRTIPKRNPENI